MHTLNLSSNKIGNDGTIQITKMLQVNSTLRVLYLFNNKIGNEGIIQIENALTMNYNLQKILINNTSNKIKN